MTEGILNVDLTISANDSEADVVKKAIDAVKVLYADLIKDLGLDPCASKGALAGSLFLDMHPGCALKVLQMTTAVVVARSGAMIEAMNEVKH